jgi:hypothetical protein
VDAKIGGACAREVSPALVASVSATKIGFVTATAPSGAEPDAASKLEYLPFLCENMPPYAAAGSLRFEIAASTFLDRKIIQETRFRAR